MTELRYLGSSHLPGQTGGSLCFYPTGDRLASASHEWDDEQDDVFGVLQIWRPDTGVQTSHRDVDAGPWAALSPDGKLLVWGGLDGQLRLLDGETGSLSDTLQMEEGRRKIAGLLFTPDGKYLLTSVGRGGADPTGAVNVWEVSTWRRLFALRTGWVMSLALSADGRTLAVGLVDGGAQLWDMASRKQLLSIPSAHAAQVRSVAIDPTSKWLATTCSDDSLKLWGLGDDPPSCRVLQERTWRGGCTAVAFLPTGELLSGDGPGDVCVWDAAAGRVTWRHSIVEGFPDYEGLGVTTLAVSADSSKVAVGDSEGGVSLYAVEPGG